MWHRLIAVAIGSLTFFMMPAMALARSSEPEKEIVDARLEAYGRDVTLPSQSSALTWILLVFMGIVCLAVLFKDPKRSHLD